MKIFYVKPIALAVSLLAMTSLLPSPAAGQSYDAASPEKPASEALDKDFQNPPPSARPRVWWHWMNGNITKDGITKDLEWMKRIGIGGFQNFDANLETPTIVDKRLVYMTPEWKDAFRFAITTADRLGLEAGIAASPGWSETGGPWVMPKDGMKKLVWSETLVAGGKPVAIKLANPSAVSGPFQHLPIGADGGDSFLGPSPFTPPTHFEDVAVLAYPLSNSPSVSEPRITSEDAKPIDASALTDDSLTSFATLAKGTSAKPAAIRFDYDKPQTFQSAVFFAPATVTSPVNPGLRPQLQSSDDGAAWRTVAEIEPRTIPITVSFAPVTARHFRFVFAPAPQTATGSTFTFAPGLDMTSLIKAGAPGGTAKSGLRVHDLRLLSEPRINQFEVKAGFATAPDYYALDAQVGGDTTGVRVSSVVDLTARMQPDGSLDWTPPKGNWRIVRLGWSLTGKANHPATDEATGLEVDKMDPVAVRAYLNQYLSMYRDAAGADQIGAKGINALLTDSTEVGAFNWTGRMREEFKRLRGYDPTPWLPTLTGVVVGSRSQSDAFLYDFRRTIADLHATAHYATVAEVAHENGLKLYGEALESGRPSLGDDLAMRRYTDYPMAAMWYFAAGTPPSNSYYADTKGASSVAHLYGQNIAAAESLTSLLSPYTYAPSGLRHVIDLEFAYGINRPVLHSAVHQPVDDKVPGLALNIFGQYFNRHETWAEMAGPWIAYIARNSLMLQQGRNVADVAFFYGEEAPLVSLFNQGKVEGAPRTYAYDFINADALTDLVKVEGGDLTTPAGARYRVLYLGGRSQRMTLPTLRRMAALVDQGATVVGNAPESSPSLADDKAAFAALVGKLWGGKTSTAYGRGQVIAGTDVEAALASMGVSPDFTYTKPQGDSEVLFVHRKLADGDIYYVNNRNTRAEQIEARFRVTGKVPEIWRADTGQTEPVSYRIEGNQTIVPLDMLAEDSFFLVFRKPATAVAAVIPKPQITPVATLDGAWTVTFQSGRGAPPSISLPSLASLSTHAEPGVKYFSGVATYTKDFMLPRGLQSDTPLLLDLGQVAEIAEVRVNGKPVGTAWHAPFRLDIRNAVTKGRNKIEIKVANLWVNRLIGDAQPGANKMTFSSGPGYTAKAPLRPSGLIGPVTLSEMR